MIKGASQEIECVPDVYMVPTRCCLLSFYRLVNCGGSYLFTAIKLFLINRK